MTEEQRIIEAIQAAFPGAEIYIYSESGKLVPLQRVKLTKFKISKQLLLELE